MATGRLIALFTDFGLAGPYVGQMLAVLHELSPDSRCINLFADAPTHRPGASAYLLAAFTAPLPAGAITVAVVDPGVGSFRDRPLLAEIDRRWYVGPDNGLFNAVLKAGAEARCWEITWRPEHLSKSFHGRDLYAPVAAMIANGAEPPGQPVMPRDLSRWPTDLAEVVYVDHFGNAMTGLRASALPTDTLLEVRGRRLEHAQTFADVASGSAFWFENSSGLAEIAVNCGRADDALGLGVGTSVTVLRRGT